MRIALVIPYNPLEEVGGLELSTIRFFNELKRQGLEPACYTLGKSGFYRNVQITGFKDFDSLCQNLLKESAQFDVIHWLEIFPEPGQIEKQLLISGYLRLMGKKIVLMVATSGNLEKRGSSPIAIELMKEYVNAFIISNPEQFDEFAKYGLTKNIHMFGFGVDTDNHFSPVGVQEKKALRDKLRLPQEKVLFLFIGRFVDRKRPDFLLESWQKMDEYYGKAELVVVGSGMDQHDSIESSVVELAKNTRSVEFRGMHEVPEDYYRACDFLLLPSEREGQPNVLIEAMSCAMPIIASDIAGIRELITNGDSGILFPASDKARFVEIMKQALRSPEKYIKLGQKAREVAVKERDIKMVTKMYVDLYTKILESK